MPRTLYEKLWSSRLVRGNPDALMALQAGMPPLDFSGVQGRERRRYFDAVHGAMAGNLAPMMLVFERIIA